MVAMVVVVVVVVLLATMGVCAYLHLVQVAEHLAVRLPVSPPPGPQRPGGWTPKTTAFLQQKDAISRPAGSQRETTSKSGVRLHEENV